ncbi:thioredoxin family protein [Candidatus Kaiserbacteria bacterium]|nr:thioredoxin family protein [Candidatus Kaiserbacteria bacterium]
MNKTIGLIVLVVAIGIGWYISRPHSTEENSAVMQDAGESMTREDVPHDGVMVDDADSVMESDAMHTGSYEAYSPEKLGGAENGDVVLFFRAGWCPTCQAVDADIRAHLDDIPSDLTILDVNYDDSDDLKRKYGVVYQHTFVQVDAAGNMLKKWSGSPTLAALVGQVE